MTSASVDALLAAAIAVHTGGDLAQTAGAHITVDSGVTAAFLR